jgi:hypothetical protein
VDAVPGADFRYTAVVISVCIDQYGLRVRSFEHLLQVRVEQALIEAILRRVFGCKLPVWFNDPHDINLRTMERLLEEPLDVSVNQTDDGDTKRRVGFSGLGVSMWGCEPGKYKDRC